MNSKTLLLGFVLFDFALLSLYAMYQVGYLGIWQAGLASWGAIQLLVDLVILGGLAALWIIGDARARGMNPWPYVLLTLAGGSFGPLVYLLRREWRTGQLFAQPA